jgi:WD40 repeat protein
VQDWFSNVVAADPSGAKFAFTSTLAVYIVASDSYSVDQLISAHERTITGIIWNPHDSNQVATSSLDGVVKVWDLSIEEAVYSTKFSTDAPPAVIDWSFESKTKLAIACQPTGEVGAGVAAPSVTVNTWDFSSDISSSQSVKELVSRKGISCAVLRWNPRKKGFLAVGLSDGTITVCDVQTDKIKKVVPKEKLASVVDLQWDVLSDFYAVVSYRSGDIFLWDMESETALSSFDRQGAGVRCLAWMTYAPGNFATVNNRTGVIRIWNASQKQPLELIKVSEAGFNSFIFLPNSERALGAFKDGSVGVFNIAKRRVRS